MKNIYPYLLFALAFCFSIPLFSQAQKIVPSQGWDESFFGYELGIANDQLIAADHGLLYFYEQENGTWTEKDLVPISHSSPDPLYMLPSLAIDEEAIAGVKRFGFSESQKETGAVYFFSKNNGTWEQSQRLEPDFLNPGDQFGTSVSILGDIALVGAPGDDEMGVDNGAAYLLKKENGKWSIKNKLFGSNLTTAAIFGTNVHLASDRLIVGATGYEHLGSRAGAAFVFKKSGDDWIEEGVLLPSDTDFDFRFGRKVRVENNLAVVSSGTIPSMYGEYKGAAYFYSFNGSEWQEEGKVVGEENWDHDGFAWNIDLSESYVVLGAVWEGGDDHMDYSGRAYVYKREAGQWLRVTKLAAFDGSGLSLFGSAIGIAGTQLAIGASSDHTVHGSAGGSIYIFDLDIVSPTEEVSIFQETNVRLSPNPAEDFLQIENGSTDMEIAIFNLAGRVLEKRKYDNKTIDVSEWNPGIYFLQMTNGEESVVQKFIKN